MDIIIAFSRQAMYGLVLHHHRCLRWKQFGSIVLTGRSPYHPQFHQCHHDASNNDLNGITQQEIKEGKHKERSGMNIRDNGHTLATQNRSVESPSLIENQGNTTKSVDGAYSTRSTSDTSRVSKSSMSSSTQDDSIKGKNSTNDTSEKTLHDDKSGRKEPPVAPDPETCCESGCVNCVWIKYAEEVKDYYPDHQERLKEIVDSIEDYNVKMFVRMELGIKK
ncbi:uncharacterized protein LOC121423359 [Lytechinus variegatus]|uniref:uncharacterized protein LOC121423359 n=1 Tax=Lytechinus variegatus TaxID=7654 RepID=UPI001BB1DF4E|nr:uncharacterized protein LOC121423359 [Lytechinus variegatus]